MSAIGPEKTIPLDKLRPRPMMVRGVTEETYTVEIVKVLGKQYVYIPVWISELEQIRRILYCKDAGLRPLVVVKDNQEPPSWLLKMAALMGGAIARIYEDRNAVGIRRLIPTPDLL